MDVAKNFAKVTVSDGNYDDTSTSIDLISSDGVKLPSAPFNVVWWNATDYPDPADDPNKEIVRVTAISTDTLTITRAQEGTDAVEHNALGKTYKMIACLTAKVINQDVVGDVQGTGPALLPDLANSKITLRHSDARYIELTNDHLEINSQVASIGDQQAAFNGTYLAIDDDGTRIVLSGRISSNQTESASVAPGTLVGKLPIYDLSNTIVGYVPIYSSIT